MGKFLSINKCRFSIEKIIIVSNQIQTLLCFPIEDKYLNQKPETFDFIDIGSVNNIDCR